MSLYCTEFVWMYGYLSFLRLWCGVCCHIAHVKVTRCSCFLAKILGLVQKPGLQVNLSDQSETNIYKFMHNIKSASLKAMTF